MSSASWNAPCASVIAIGAASTPNLVYLPRPFTISADLSILAIVCSVLATLEAALTAKGFTPGGKIDPGNPIWKGQGYEFATKEDGTYMKDSSGNPIVTKAPSGSGKVSIPLPGLNVDIDISTFDYGTIDPGTYILGDLSIDSPIRKALKDSGLFKDLPEIDYSKYRVRITEVDGKGTFMKVTKIPTVTSSVNPDTQDAADVTLGL